MEEKNTVTYGKHIGEFFKNNEPIHETPQEPKKNNSKTNIIVGVIVLLFVVSIIVIGNYNTTKQEEAEIRFQQGRTEGIRQAISYLVSQAANCQPVPITMQDQTIRLIDVECLG